MNGRPIFLAALLLLCALRLEAQTGSLSVSFDQAEEMLRDGNRSIRIAEQQLDWAKKERQRLNAFWYPNISASGAYVHMANSVRVEESLASFTDPVKNFIQTIDPGEQLITSLLEKIGSHSFSLPLAPADLTTIDAVVTLPLFTGGKRIYAGRIGRAMVGIAEVNRQQVGATQHILLVETYFGVRLAQKVVQVKRETFRAMELHLQNALKLEATGMLTKTERLLFQVNRDEARRELEAAEKELSVAEDALKTLVRLETDRPVVPISPLFINPSLPGIDYFRELGRRNNYVVSGLGMEQEIQRNRIKTANSGYLPTIGLFGKQTLYAHGIQKNLLPRSLVGVGFTWNIFDGLGREKSIRQARITDRMLTDQREKAADEIQLAVDKFYSQTQIALDNVTALQTTVEMSREIVRARQKSFLEGIATSTEVIDAELLLSKVTLATLMAFYEFDTGLINLLGLCGTPEEFDRYRREGYDEQSVLCETTAWKENKHDYKYERK